MLHVMNATVNSGQYDELWKQARRVQGAGLPLKTLRKMGRHALLPDKNPILTAALMST